MSSTLEQAEQYIPAEVVMISGCRDEQTSADVSNVGNFSLPDPAGRAGGACTSSLLKVLYDEETTPETTPSFQEVLLEIRGILSEKNFSQIPQLSASRPLDIKMPFTIVPENFTGTRHALMIGINYHGQNGELRGCISDVLNMEKYIKNVHGFEDDNITLLLDDDEHTSPTKDNILAAYKAIVAKAQPGDAVFCHYSGHGAKVKDDDGDEKDGYDETLVPLDYESAGLIRDDDLFKTLVGPLQKGVHMFALFDCCHSGTVLDLPYIFVADGSQEEMTEAPDFDFGTLVKLFDSFMAAKQNGQSTEAAAVEAVSQLCGCSIM